MLIALGAAAKQHAAHTNSIYPSFCGLAPVAAGEKPGPLREFLARTQLSHTRFGVSDPGTGRRPVEQLSHTTWPQLRQWCRRRSSVNGFEHSRQDGCEASGCQRTPYLAAARAARVAGRSPAARARA